MARRRSRRNGYKSRRRSNRTRRSKKRSRTYRLTRGGVRL